jgi:hypothetical protein
VTAVSPATELALALRPGKALMKRTAWLLSGLLLILGGCSPPPPPHAPGDISSSGAGPTGTPPVNNSVNRPRTVPGARASLADSDEVIGLVVGGQARAYRLEALKVIARHVVNDVVNKTAVTVTYCDRNDCVRTFTDDSDRPLPIGVAGYRNGLLLRVGDGLFYQKNAKAVGGGQEVAYRSAPYKRTTWAEWKKDHPDTDVYVGESGAPGSPVRPRGDW